MTAEEIICELNKRYGAERGRKVYTTIMPGIFADFQKMLKAAAPGENVREEYILEDGKGKIRVTGKRLADGRTEIGFDLV